MKKKNTKNTQFVQLKEPHLFPCSTLFYNIWDILTKRLYKRNETTQNSKIARMTTGLKRTLCSNVFTFPHKCTDGHKINRFNQLPGQPPCLVIQKGYSMKKTCSSF